jgi:hypothetical protein
MVRHGETIMTIRFGFDHFYIVRGRMRSSGLASVEQG